jgi:hypothetical protein
LSDTIELVEIEPGRWRVRKEVQIVQRSALPLPYVISDIMEPTEQVDGRFYTSKSAFRAVGRSLGLTEVGNEKLGPKRRATEDRQVREARRSVVHKAVERFASGERTKA